MKVDVRPPDFLSEKPAPTSTLRPFHRRKIQIWEGEVHVSKVHGWVKNKRTDLHVRSWKLQYGREPSDDELYQLVVNDEFQKIKALANNIYQNGVRVPIILAKDGRLLDGNRRYFATRFLLDDLPPNERGEYENIPAWVLAESTEEADELNIITERNLVHDQKLQWPYYVQALQVYEDREDNGFSVKEIAEKYEWTSNRVRQALQAVGLADEFASYHDESDAAYRLAYENLIWFDQLARSHSKLLDSDVDFKEGVFKMLLEEPRRFNNTRDFLKLGEIRRNPDAWAKLTSTAGSSGLEEATEIVAAEKLDAKKDPAGRLERLTRVLRDAVDSGHLGLAPEDALRDFHELASKVPAGPAQPEWQFAKMIEWLDGMTVEEVAKLDGDLLTLLTDAQSRVHKMAEAWSQARAGN